MKSCWIRRIILGLALAFALLSPSNWGRAYTLAQEGEPDGPIYIVQEGDSLWDIALRFRVTMEDLALANGINDPNQLVIGVRLVIPGLEGIQGVLITQSIPYGETLRSLSRRYRVPENTLIRLNHLASPAELFVGSTLVIPEPSTEIVPTRRDLLTPGQPLLELAILSGSNPWDYVLANDLAGTWSAIPGDVFHSSGNDVSTPEEDGPGALPPPITEVRIEPDSLTQGKAAVIEIAGQGELLLSGSLIDREIHFFPGAEGGYASLQGIHAMTEPGLYPLVLTGTLPVEAPYFGAPFSFSQAVLIGGGNYAFDPVLIVSRMYPARRSRF